MIEQQNYTTQNLFKPIFNEINMKGMYQHIRQAWKKPDMKVLRKRMTEWRKTDTIVHVDKPLRLDRARALGYKAKKGFVVLRVRVGRGGHKQKKPNRGRRSKRQTNRKDLKMSYQWIAEQRAGKKYTNLEVLNSYKIGKDGMFYFYEVIMVDPQRPEIKSDKQLSWIGKPGNRNRVMRGLTSAGKKSRGMKNKHPTSKVRPSVRAGGRLGK